MLLAYPLCPHCGCQRSGGFDPRHHYEWQNGRVVTAKASLPRNCLSCDQYIGPVNYDRHLPHKP
jgi:hypothetical protein